MSRPEAFDILGADFLGCQIEFDTAPPKELVDRIIQAVGERARDAMKVEVAFSEILIEGNLGVGEWWSRTSKDLVSVPLGPRGARDVQTLDVGTGLAHHALIVGRPGSGKTNLMHVVITSLSLAYPPDELELYLIDFKKGVGFKAYADHELPHARVIAIESEREFGISVLRGLDQELTRRGELFREAGGAEKLSEYREQTGKTMSRILLVADEFQEFFTVEDSISREASLLFDRIVRQGRAFGIHLILGTQTLAGSYGLGRSTLDQMSIRLALQCSDADSRLILGDDNPGAKFLSRPGEAIYNAENGAVQANKLFQVAIFTDEDKARYLSQLRTYRPEVARRKPVVFEGQLPAKLESSETISKALAGKERPNLRRGVSCWVGEPIALKEPNVAAARFRRQSGANLAVVTRDEEQGIGVVMAALTTLAIQHADDACRFMIADYSTPDSDWAEVVEDFSDAIPHESKVVTRRQVPDTVKELLRELEARQGQSGAPATNLFFAVIGLHRSRELRKDEDDFNPGPADDLLKVMREGPEVGIHTLVWCDTPAGLTRTLGRKALAEFGLRIAGVMGVDDSQAFLDDSAAAKIDRPHRMLLFDEERPGLLEKLRPFSIPTKSWLTRMGAQLQEGA